MISDQASFPPTLFNSYIFSASLSQGSKAYAYLHVMQTESRVGIKKSKPELGNLEMEQVKLKVEFQILIFMVIFPPTVVSM